MMELIQSLMEAEEMQQRVKGIRLGSIVEKKMEETGLKDFLEKLAYSDNPEVADAVYNVLMLPQDMQITLDASLPQVSGFVFS